MKTRTLAFISALLILLAMLSALTYASDAIFETGSYNGIFGMRHYKVYLPKGWDKSKKSSVVVMIHGCEQNASLFAEGTRIVQWADKEKFIVLLPEQNINYNPFKCWNWVLPVNNARTGETQVIIEMLDGVLKKYNGDSKNVFAAGMSSGASMVNILGNCYPERFKALASHDGTQYVSTRTGLDFADVVLYGPSVDAPSAATLGETCSSLVTHHRPKQMPIIIFHGMKSPLMSPAHAFAIENEFKIFNDLLDNGVRDTSYYLSKDVKFFSGEGRTYGYNKYTLVNPNHDVLIERYMINDLEHAWSGGVGTLPYNDPKGPDATGLIIDFFKRWGLGK